MRPQSLRNQAAPRVQIFDGGLGSSEARLPHLVRAFDGGPRASGNRSPYSVRALGGTSEVGRGRPF